MPLKAIAIIARDLHWRAFLAPGGWRRSHLAYRLLATNLGAHALLLAPIALLVSLPPLLQGEPAQALARLGSACLCCWTWW